MRRSSRSTTQPSVEGQMTPTPEAVRRLQSFLRLKWAERAAESDRPAPKDLTGACKFASLLAQSVFGGMLRGNWHHQWLEHPSYGKIDLTEADGVEPHSARCAQAGCRWGSLERHDARFWGNREHKADLASIQPRVRRWVDEFLGSASS